MHLCRAICVLEASLGAAIPVAVLAEIPPSAGYLVARRHHFAACRERG